MIAIMALYATLVSAPAPQDSLTIFLGDSRTVGIDMQIEDNNNEVYIAKVGEGYKYLKDTAWNECLKTIESNSDKDIDIIVNFGVNDLGNESKYATFINEKVAELPENVSVAYASVNPTSGKYSHLTSKIQAFNEDLKADLDENITWIDSNDYLQAEGFNSSDGLHYDGKTNQLIHDYWKSTIENL